MKRKILALILTCIMCINVLTISVSADVTNIPSNINHFVDDVSDDFNAYRNGNISLTDFIELYAKNVAKFQYNSTSDITHVKDVLLHLQSIGVDVSDFWTKYYYEYKGEKGELDDSVLNGYGALLLMECNDKRNSTRFIYNYCDYITVTYVNDRLYYAVNNRRHYVSYTWSGTVYQEVFDLVNTGYMPSSYTNYSFKLYGDVRYFDGSQADDIKEQFPEKQVPAFDDDSFSDDDLINFLDKLLENLRLSFPDLSNIEGLLNAILAKLNTLDSDDDGIALAEINAAIITLATKSDANTQQLLTALMDLKEVLTGKDEDKNETDLKEITDLLKDMKKSLKYLCDINTLDFVEDILNDLTDEEKNFLNTYAGLITSLIDKFGLVAINSMMSSLNSVILNTCAPDDLVVEIYGEDVTILSTDMFNNEAMKYIDLAKTFVSVLLLYAFCMNMRRKLTT